MGNACGTASSKTKNQTKTKQVKVVTFSTTEEPSANSRPLVAKPKIRRLRRYGQFPTIDEAHQLRGQEGETPIKEALKKILSLGNNSGISKKAQENCLQIIGEAGVGKSTLLGHILLYDDFVWQECPSVEWLMWFAVDDMINSLSLKACSLEQKLEEALLCKPSFIETAMKSFGDEDDPTNNQSKDILVVLDFGPFTIPNALKRAHFDRSTRIITISRQLSDGLGGLQLKIETFGEEKFFPGSKALAKLSNGMPQDVRLITSLPKPLQDEPISSYDDLLKIFFEKAFPALLEKVFAFLFFKPRLAVKTIDLALLWSFAKPVEAEQFCEQELTSKGLVQMLKFETSHKPEKLPENEPAVLQNSERTKGEGRTKNRKQQGEKSSRLFSITERLHEALWKNFKATHLEKLVKDAGRKYSGAKKGENILHLAVRLKRGSLIAGIVRAVDAPILTELCLEKTVSSGDSISKSVVDYLCEPDCLFTDRNIAAAFGEKKIKNFFPALALLFDKLANEPTIFEPILKANSANDLLFAAAAEGCVRLAGVLLTNSLKKADVNAFENGIERRKNSLMLASANGQEELVRLILKHGADVNKADEAGNTPIYLAARSGFEGTVKILLENGADPTCRLTNSDYWKQFGEDDTVLTAAAINGHASIVRNFLKDERVCGQKSRAAFLQAVSYHRLETVEALLEAGYDPNMASVDEQETALMKATKGGDVKIVTLLLEKGAKVDLFNKDGKTALNISAQHGQPDIAKILCEKLPSGSEKYVSEAKMMKAIYDCDKDGLKKLLESGLSANSCENGVRPPLILAAAVGNLEIAEILLEKGADPNVKTGDKAKETALIKAVDVGNVEMVKLLLKKGANPNLASSDVGTPLIYAVTHGYAEIVQALLDAKADTNAKHVRNLDTPLIIAVRSGNKRVVGALLDKGADPKQMANGQTALSIAEKRGLGDIIELLVRYENCEGRAMKATGLI